MSDAWFLDSISDRNSSTDWLAILKMSFEDKLDFMSLKDFDGLWKGDDIADSASCDAINGMFSSELVANITTGGRKCATTEKFQGKSDRSE